MKAKRDKDKSGKDKGDCPQAAQTPVAAPPVTPAIPQPSAPAQEQEQPNGDKGHGDERGNGSDKAKAKDKERDNGHDK